MLVLSEQLSACVRPFLPVWCLAPLVRCYNPTSKQYFPAKGNITAVLDNIRPLRGNIPLVWGKIPCLRQYLPVWDDSPLSRTICSHLGNIFSTPGNFPSPEVVFCPSKTIFPHCKTIIHVSEALFPCLKQYSPDWGNSPLDNSNVPLSPVWGNTTLTEVICPCLDTQCHILSDLLSHISLACYNLQQ